MLRHVKKIGLGVLTLGILGLIYYVTVARLPQEQFTQEEILAAYQYHQGYRDFKVTQKTHNSREFTFTSFDGETVYGQISLPAIKRDSYPVLVGIHAMGRSYPRWFNDAINGRPTVTNVHKITELALAAGYAVIAIDARFHGKRKVVDKPLRAIWNDLHYFGDKSDYENMVKNTVLDNRVLLDWVIQQPELDAANISVAGYSMGGQASLLLAAVDDRVKTVVSVVPPFVDNSVARVSPLNVVSNIQHARVLMIYGEYDDVASPAENQLVFNTISSHDKHLSAIPADHILPVDYVQQVSDWLFRDGL